MNVSVIGGTGFVGSHLVERLVADGHVPHLLVRPGSGSKVVQPEHCRVFEGDVADPAALAACLAGCEAVIYLIGILRERPEHGITFEELQLRGVERTIAAARRAGIGRFLLMSANGVEAQATPYQRTKYEAEEALKASDLAWTIFRPSVIFGDPRGRMEFCSQLKQDIIDSPLPVPLFFDGLAIGEAGRFQLAPVSVRDVAAAFSGALGEPATIGATYPLCGPAALTWKEILTTIAAASGKTKLMLPAPAVVIKAVAGLLDRWPWFPITRDQIQMLLQGNVCDSGDAFAQLGIVPQRFDVAALDYLKRD
ncbi:NAD(P)H-binding protein [Thiococcus pfennigii]|uniref:NAD(P)H-binding protein n=1 Tax=Thiococcus pfennigii TaxID=1057 RepID=UPI001905AEEC|nr:NAD(P)H-binding protein [Thiococcus pfennigii]MBK1701222.1 epimerase [Thiococcus pfennigii]